MLRRLKPYRWTILASFLLAVIIGSFAYYGLSKPFYCTLESYGGIKGDTESKRWNEFNVFSNHEEFLGGFPPRSRCTVYGAREGKRGRYGPTEVVSSKEYPSNTEYLWRLLLVLSPILIQLIFRLVRGGVRRVRPQARDAKGPRREPGS